VRLSLKLQRGFSLIILFRNFSYIVEKIDMLYKNRGGIYGQQDATNSQSLLLKMLYMFRAIIAHHQELGTVCAAVRCYTKLCGSLFSRLYSRRGVSVVIQSFV
jgi:hypothetical protein